MATGLRRSTRSALLFRRFQYEDLFQRFLHSVVSRFTSPRLRNELSKFMLSIALSRAQTAERSRGAHWQPFHPSDQSTLRPATHETSGDGDVICVCCLRDWQEVGVGGTPHEMLLARLRASVHLNPPLLTFAGGRYAPSESLRDRVRVHEGWLFEKRPSISGYLPRGIASRYRVSVVVGRGLRLDYRRQSISKAPCMANVVPDVRLQLRCLARAVRDSVIASIGATFRSTTQKETLSDARERVPKPNRVSCARCS
ncbi:protein of unknown function [Pararobbsia alpina]